MILQPVNTTKQTLSGSVRLLTNPTFLVGFFFCSGRWPRSRYFSCACLSVLFRPHSSSGNRFPGLPKPLKGKKEATAAPSSSYSAPLLPAGTASVPYSDPGTAHNGDHGAVSHPRSYTPPSLSALHTLSFPTSSAAAYSLSPSTLPIRVASPPSAPRLRVHFSRSGHTSHTVLSDR